MTDIAYLFVAMVFTLLIAYLIYTSRKNPSIGVEETNPVPDVAPDEPFCDGDCENCEFNTEDELDYEGVEELNFREGTVAILDGGKRKVYKDATVVGYADNSPLVFITGKGSVIQTNLPYTFEFDLPTFEDVTDDTEGEAQE